MVDILKNLYSKILALKIGKVKDIAQLGWKKETFFIKSTELFTTREHYESNDDLSAAAGGLEVLRLLFQIIK